MSVQNFNLDIDDYTIAAGGYLELGKPADFFQIMQAIGPVDITFLHSESAVGKAKGVGQGFRLGPLSNRFYGVKIYSATAQTLKLCFSSGKSPVDLSQVVSVTGTVAVINGEIERVKQGLAFSGTAYQGALAGNFSHVQLWNPVASGKNLIVNRLSVASFTAATEIAYVSQSAALGTLMATQPKSKNLNSVFASVAQLRSQASVSTVGVQMGSVSVPSAFSIESVPFSEPILVPPGFGFAAYIPLVNHTAIGTFQWIEEII